MAFNRGLRGPSSRKGSKEGLLVHILPFMEWIGRLRISTLKTDAIAGVTVALVLIPQSMAYAQLAGLPAYYGLYAAFLPPMVAALFGSSRQLATGPVAIVSLLSAVALEPLATLGSPGYIGYAILLALMVGVFQFLLGALRLGVLVNFLSHPVVNGFTNAGAIIIASSQLDKLFGVHVDAAAYHFATVVQVLAAAAQHLHWPTLLMGLAAFTIMYVLKVMAPHSPGLLVAVVVTTLISWLTGFERTIEVPIEALNAPAARELIDRYNDVTRELENLSGSRSALMARHAQLKSLNQPVAALNARHQAEILSLHMDTQENHIRELRKTLRALKFEGVAYAAGQTSGFYPYGERPQGSRGDNRQWRLMVRRKALDVNDLILTTGGEVVGHIPKGLPALSAPVLDFNAFRHLIFYTVVIALLGFMEAISVARAVAAKTGQRIDPNQELIGQGLANVAGAFTRSYPVSGSFSRTAVNMKAGATTGMSGVITSLVVVAVLLYFTPLLYHLPQAVLAAIIMMAVVGLINVRGFIHAWRAQWFDGAISIITFMATLAFAPHLDRGILIGVGLSLGVFLYKSMRPTVVDLSLGVDRALHDAVSYGLDQCHFIDVVRFDGPLFFANAGYLEDQIRDRRKHKKELKHIIIVANGINDIDASGQEALSFVVERIRSAGLDISISGANESVMAALERTHLIAKIGETHFYPTIGEAINQIHPQTHDGEHERNCPLKTVVIAHSGTQEEH